MSTALTLLGIGLMVQEVLPVPYMPIVGFILFAIGNVLMFIGR